MKKSRAFPARKICILALTTALGLLAFLIEGLFPPLLVPGAKLGLSNLFSLFTLLLYGLPEAFLVVCSRTVLGSLFAGNPSTLIYSLTAGATSILSARVFLFLFPKISITCVSILSAITHNFTQLFIYCLLTQTSLLLGYSPYLLLLGAFAGLAVGLALFYTVKHLPLSLLFGKEFSNKEYSS